MERDLYLDSTKGFLIYLVVLGHIIEPFQSNKIISDTYKFIYTFHMPAFIFIAGMLCTKPTERKPEKNALIAIIFPLITFNSMYEIAHYLLTGKISAYASNLAPHWILWFLLSLIFWRISTPALLKLRWPLATSLILSLIALSYPNTGYYLSIARTFSFLPFYVLGLTKGRDIILFLRSYKSLPTITVSTITLIIVSMISPSFSNEILYGSHSFHSMGLSIAEGIHLRLYSYGISIIAMLSVLAISLRITLFATWGKNSLLIYLWHGLAIKISLEYFDKNSISDNQVLFYTPAFLIASIFFCSALSKAWLGKLSLFLFNPMKKFLDGKQKKY